MEAAEYQYVVLSGDCSTVRQPRVEEVSSGKGDAHFIEFYRRAARLLYHRVLERNGGLADEILISCCQDLAFKFVPANEIFDYKWQQ